MNIKDIKNWFEIAIPEPTIEQACIQVGCHFEEFGEMMESINMGGTDAIINIEVEAEDFKQAYDYWVHRVKDCDKIALLDSLCDQIVTAIGVAHMLDMDIEGALEEVNRSNHSKFVDGKAVFNEQGKIDKGKFYSKPELDKFIGG